MNKKILIIATLMIILLSGLLFSLTQKNITGNSISISSFFKKLGLPREVCGNGICESREQLNLSICPKDCVIDNSTFETIGFIGCSVTHNAVEGYYLVGGKKFWILNQTNNESYSGGCLNVWYEGLNESKTNNLWEVFRTAYNENPNTTKIWFELCSCEMVSRMNYNNALEVVNKIKTIAPNTEIYVTPMPLFLDTHHGPCVDNNGPQIISNFTNRIIQERKAKAGPILTPLSTNQISIDGCHANDDGKIIWGNNLKNFFG